MADGTRNELTGPERECLQKLRVSLATAIIRNKPSNLTSREFALKISQQLKRGEESWKQKAKKLEEELLQTKQDLIHAKLKMKESFHGKFDDEDILITEFEEVDVSIPSNSSQDLSLLTPPNSSGTSSTQRGQDIILETSVNFLNSVTKMESLAVPHDFKLSRDYVTGTFKHSVHIMSEHYKNWLRLEHLPRSLVQRGTLAMAKVLKSSIIDGHRAEVIQECQSLIKCVLDTLVNCNKLGRMEFLESSLTLVTTLSKSTHLGTFTLECLLEHIQRVAEELKMVVSQQKMPKPAACENCLCLFQMVESLLLDNDESSKVMDRKVLKDFQSRLEDATLHLTDCFPLYTQYIWKLVSAIELMVEDIED